jgi:NitT/TauT family transport system substrate-binding protein
MPRWMRFAIAAAAGAAIVAGALARPAPAAAAETIRIAIGTQDTTINCATGGLIIRELKLLEKYLPHGADYGGKYQDVRYDVSWKNFTAGAPLTSEMVAHVGGRQDGAAVAAEIREAAQASGAP